MISVPAQPKDPNDNLYKVIRSHLMRGDQKVIAIETGSDEPTVSRVLKGKRRTIAVWKALATLALKRKQEQDTFK
jgi:DNA transposition AAA+ family ATPase